MNKQRYQKPAMCLVALAVGLLLGITAALPARADDSITDPTQADQVLLERAKVAKQIVVDGKPGTLQAEQEKAAMDQAQQGWASMDAAKQAAAERKAAWEARKQAAAVNQKEREAKYWEASMNMERLLARQQEIQDERDKNERLAQQRDLKDWTVVGDATQAGFAAEQQREQIRQENLRRYQASLQSGYASLQTKPGETVQQELDNEQKARSQQLLIYNLRYWNEVMQQSADGKQQQDAVIQANRENQIRHLKERVKEWSSIDENKDAQLRDQSVREQVRQANAQRYQEQLRQDYMNSRAGESVVTAPSAAAGTPAAAPADATATAQP